MNVEYAGRIKILHVIYIICNIVTCYIATDHNQIN